MKNVVTETENLVIRRFTLGDIKPLHKIFGNKQNTIFSARSFSLRDTEDWVIRSVQRYSQNGTAQFALLLKETNTIIGNVGLMSRIINDNWENALCIIVDAKHCSKGFGLEAAKAILEYGYKKLKLERVVMSIPCHHSAAIHLAEKLGLNREKIFINERERGAEYWLYATL